MGLPHTCNLLDYVSMADLARRLRPDLCKPKYNCESTKQTFVGGELNGWHRPVSRSTTNFLRFPWNQTLQRLLGPKTGKAALLSVIAYSDFSS